MWPLCLCSLNTKFSRFICIIACICTPSPFIPECYSVVWLYYTLFICSSLDGHLSCLHLFATVFSTATHIRIKVFGWTPAFDYFGYIPRSGNAGSLAILGLSYWGSSNVFYRVAPSLEILISNAQCSNCSTFSQTLISYWLWLWS